MPQKVNLYQWKSARCLRLKVAVGSSLLVWGLVTASAATGNIRINEIMVNNAHCTNVDGSVTPWVELLNVSASASVNLLGYSLTDSNTYPLRYVFNWDVTIPPRGLYLITCDSNKPASPTNMPFGLGKNGGYVYLHTNFTAVDYIQYGLQPVD